MRVAIMTSVGGNGGSAATAFHVTRMLKTVGWQPVLFAPGEYWAARGKREDVEVKTLELKRGFRPLSFFRDLSAFRAFIRGQKPKLVLVQKSPEQWLAFLAIKLSAHKPTLIRLRGVTIPVKAGLFNRWLHAGMAGVICSATVIAEQYGSSCPQSKLKVVLEGVDTQRFAPATKEQKAAARRALGLPNTGFFIGTAGRPAPVKGHDILVGAFGAAWELIRPPTSNPKSPKDPRLIIFCDESRRGPGSYNDLQSMVARLGRSKEIIVRAGYVEDMRLVYQALDVYVLASRGSEGSSRAALEACASGLPLIASSVGVLPDIVQDGVTGRLIKPGDVESLQAALTELFEEWPGPLQWGAAARVHMENELNNQRFAQKLQFVLEGMIDTASKK